MTHRTFSPAGLVKVQPADFFDIARSLSALLIELAKNPCLENLDRAITALTGIAQGLRQLRGRIVHDQEAQHDRD